MAKIVDSFTAFNEIEVAEFRINYLWDLVERFVIAESHLTHSGVEKPLYFQNWLQDNPKYRKKVEIIRVDLSYETNSWSREIRQREELARYLLNKYQGRKFILSDLDEIPSVSQVKTFLNSEGSFKYETAVYFRYANFRVQNNFTWARGCMGGSELLKLENGGRFSELPRLVSLESGLHLSYMGGSRAASYKLQSFAHEELSFEELSSARVIEYANNFGIDHLGSFNSKNKGLLKIESINEIKGMQKELHIFKPNLFDFNEIKHSLFKRKFASLILTIIRLDPKYRGILYRTFILKDSKSHTSDLFLSYVLVSKMFVWYEIKKGIRYLIVRIKHLT